MKPLTETARNTVQSAIAKHISDVLLVNPLEVTILNHGVAVMVEGDESDAYKVCQYLESAGQPTKPEWDEDAQHWFAWPGDSPRFGPFRIVCDPSLPDNEIHVKNLSTGKVESIYQVDTNSLETTRGTLDKQLEDNAEITREFDAWLINRPEYHEDDDRQEAFIVFCEERQLAIEAEEDQRRVRFYMGDIVTVKLSPVKDRWREAVITDIVLPHGQPPYIKVRFKGAHATRCIETSELGKSFRMGGL